MSKEIEWKYNIGDVVQDKTKRDTAIINLTIVDRKVNQIRINRKDRKCGYQNRNDKWYKYHCNVCNNEDWISESNLFYSHVGCNVCGFNSQKVLVGYNDIATTAPQLIKFMTNKNDQYQYSAHSTKTILCNCPICGYEKRVKIYNLYEYGFSCPQCSDGYSYPEKFIASLFHQLNIDYISEYNNSYQSWIEKYRYDFYLPHYNCIVEVHGLQHYEECSLTKENLREVQDNDYAKENLAKLNNIDKYIIIDARYSKKDYIKESIINSELNSLFNLNIIDFNLCDEMAQKSKVKDSCDLWEKGESIKNISKLFHCSIGCIEKYLHKGSKLGWCSYTNTSERKRVVKNIKWKRSKPLAISFNKNVLGEFNSINSLCKLSQQLFGCQFNPSKISLVCNNKRKLHKGFNFNFISNETFYNDGYILTQEYYKWKGIIKNEEKYDVAL